MRLELYIWKSSASHRLDSAYELFYIKKKEKLKRKEISMVFELP